MESACNEWLSFTRSPGSFAWLCPWAKQAGTMLGRATRNSARVKRLLKSEVIRASFTFKSVPSKDGLAYVTECHNIQNPALAACVRGANKAPSDHGSA